MQVNVPHYRYEYNSLADWKIERGDDLRRNSFAWFFGLLITIPPVALLVLPFSVYYGHKGKNLQREGEHEGGKGRPWRARGSRFVPATNWELECGPNVRRHSAPANPPEYLLTP